ncbi:protein ROS1 [Artemisia annua]|uniref:Protein ROS1 n=1 Tax=Artemisia annua TaxID=35608 RepID=A0A2U1QNJ5_ARTAN|nr:protein ROS1 [Artemisia annua]
MDNKVGKNKRKHASICIDFTLYSINEKRYDLRPRLPIPKKHKLVEPPSTKRSKKVLSDKKKKHNAKFKPKVMMDSPFTPPKQDSLRSKKKKVSCRRALDFGSSSTDSEGKGVVVYTRSGFRLGRTFRKCMHKEPGQQKSLQCIEKEEREWMKSEQVLFRERALSFIRSISLVQGNRPFMGWKGSVVDSVVGVFLAQNTSDKTSSSIFMSLAAKYPNKSTIKDPKNDSRTEHALDWNAIRCAHVDDISHAIQGRGQHNRLATRIQTFLDKMDYTKSGLYDIEWLRNAEPEKAKEYFMAVFGLGVKSTECLRLLTLRQEALPVDTHVSRIMVRLGWVQIGKLPDGFLLHQLKEYELHYQMITFGKVFCTKGNPNCNSCPLKKDCEHHKSELLSFSSPAVENRLAPVTPSRTEEPMKPTLIIADIEDLCVPKVPPAVIETEELLTGVWNHMSENNMPLKENAVCKAIVTVSAKKPSRRRRKVRSAGRLRTEHQVYELQDWHPLVQGLDKRDRDDKHHYLLATWPPGETRGHSLMLTEKCSSSEPCKDDPRDEDTILGTFLVPCRTATRGSFPLDGTYFQINEVFADDDTSEKPLVIPRKLLSDLDVKTLYCGTSISTIFQGTKSTAVLHSLPNKYMLMKRQLLCNTGLSTQEVRDCFWEDYKSLLHIICPCNSQMWNLQPWPVCPYSGGLEFKLSLALFLIQGYWCVRVHIPTFDMYAYVEVSRYKMELHGRKCSECTQFNGESCRQIDCEHSFLKLQINDNTIKES